MKSLHHVVAEALRRDAAALGQRWQTQARAVAPRVSGAAADHVEGERGERVVLAIASALGDGPCGQQSLVRAGWDLGAASHGDELSLHYLLKELSLLSAILLYAGERVLTELPAADAASAGAAAGLAVARRLQRAVSLLTLAATKGFTHGYLSDLRDHYRTLRHDLRNPLGTIRSAITLMEDQSVAPETRNDPRFRAMVVRNATSIDRLIGRQLADAVTEGPALARQAVSLLEIARAVRRDLREEAAERGCEIRVDEALPTRHLDPVGAELALRGLLTEALEAAGEGSVLLVSLQGEAEGMATLLVVREGPSREGAPDRPIPADLAEEITIWCDGRVEGTVARARLEIPAVPAAPASPPAAEAHPAGNAPQAGPRGASTASSSSASSGASARRGPSGSTGAAEGGPAAAPRAASGGGEQR